MGSLLPTPAAELNFREYIQYVWFLDDHRLVGVDNPGQVVVIDSATSEQTWLGKEPVDPLVDVVFHPGKRLVLVFASRFEVWEVKSGTLKRVAQTRVWDGWAKGPIAVSADGERIAVKQTIQPRENPDNFAIQAFSTTGENLGELVRGTRGLTSLAWSPCGRFLAGELGGLRLVVWDVEWGVEVGELKATGTRLFRRPRFHPSGRFLVAGGANLDGGVYSWDTTTWQEMVGRHWPTGPVYHVAFSPDGHLAVAAGERGAITVWDVDD